MLMPKVKYRVTALALSLILIFASYPSFAIESSGKCGDDLYWEYSSNVLTISGSGKMYDFIQKTPQNKPGEAPWRLYDASIARVVIEEGCESIGNYAFFNFIPIVEVVLPEKSLKSIGQYAFSRCSRLKNLVLPDSLEEMGINAFASCTSLVSVDFGSSSADIPNSAFSGDTALTSVKMSKNCRAVGASAFAGCSKLSSCDLSSLEVIESLSFRSTALESISLGATVDRLMANAFSGCTKLGTVSFDETARPSYVSNLFLNGTPYYSALPGGMYTLFGGYVLLNKGTYKKARLVIPDGIEMIAEAAFDKSAVSEVVIPDSVRTIGDFAFRDCTNLKSVFVPPTVERLGANCFGKYTKSMEYLRVDGFELTGLGVGAAALYAESELFPYTCLHDFERRSTVADCTSGGERLTVCKYCGACTEKKTVAPTSHTPDSKFTLVSTPDCAHRGEISRLCTTCGAAVEKIEIEKTAHSIPDEYTLVASPTCTKDGEEALVCRICGEWLSSRTVAATGHTPEAAPRVTTLPSEDGALRGCRVTVCALCGEILSVEWTKGGDSDGRGEMAALYSALRAESDAPLSSLDFCPDGHFDAKDAFALKRLMSVQEVTE